jgi:O-acetyl-ADP-ribose deacetylase (regulator of RNase III)
MNHTEKRLYLIRELLHENPQYSSIEIPTGPQQQQLLLRALMNVRMPHAISPDFKSVQDAYLQEDAQTKGVVSSNEFPDGISIWQGDITRLGTDAIVNAANEGLTGCYIPNHSCIDNAIHTFAGIELRNECADIMKKQGHPEETGLAKITDAYNLPSQYVIHTVGPMVNGDVPTELEKQQLQSSYLNSLQLAAQNEIESIAFPCISTGVFHFPNQLAAQIAVATVKSFLQKKTSVKKVIFNVFKDEDKAIYEQLLQKGSARN